MPYAPSGQQHHLFAADQELVAVEIGGGIRSYSRGGRDMIDGYRCSEICSGGRGQILAPWPNRVGDGRFSWQGSDHQLDLSEPERSNAIHGLVRWLPWTLDDAGEASLRLACRLTPRPGWPGPLRLADTYTLGEDGLAVTTAAVNEGGAGACPFGLGWHPYIAAFGGVVDDLQLRLPANVAYTSDDRGLPVGRERVDGGPLDFRHGRRVGSAALDVAFTDLARDDDGRAVTEFRDSESGDGVRLWADPSFTHLMVYTGDTLGDTSRRRRAVAIEPMTCAPDMLRTGDGLLTLEEGQHFQASWGLQSLKF